MGQLKTDPLTQPIPVVILTNLSDKEESEKAIAKGAVKYIVKSEYAPEELTQTVQEVLAQT